MRLASAALYGQLVCLHPCPCDAQEGFPTLQAIPGHTDAQVGQISHCMGLGGVQATRCNVCLLCCQHALLEVVPARQHFAWG